MPYLGSNIPSNIFYASINFEILPIARKTSDLINMIASVNILLIQMTKQRSECTYEHFIFEKDLWQKVSCISQVCR